MSRRLSEAAPAHDGSELLRPTSMHPALAAAFLIGLLTREAVAEPDPSGTWRAAFSTQRSERHQATMFIDIAAGTWITLARGKPSRREPCAGRKLPVTLVGGGSSTVTLSILASKVDAKCPDRTARLTVVDTDTMEGQFSNGDVLRLERVVGR